jgi:hypothetical protein
VELHDGFSSDMDVLYMYATRADITVIIFLYFLCERDQQAPTPHPPFQLHRVIIELVSQANVDHDLGMLKKLEIFCLGDQRGRSWALI